MTQHRDIQHRDIKLLVMDVDGVMTNGQVTYSSEGHELKSFNVKDGLGINGCKRQVSTRLSSRAESLSWLSDVPPSCK